MQDSKLRFESRDEFKRQPIAENLVKLLMSEVDVSPLMIDGDWGTGKSEFCIKTIELIREKFANQLHVIHVNAFQEDHIDQPLLSLLGALYISFADKLENEEFKTNLLKRASTLLKVTGKAAVAHLLKVNAEDVGPILSECLNKGTQESNNSKSETLFKQYCSANQKIESFKNLLSQQAIEKPIVFFIDELDRCRPTYAINLLEVVKHIFDIPKVKIIFIANLQQLKISISHCYGGSPNAEKNYLEKFISHIISLPPVVRDTNSLASEKYLFSLIHKYDDLKDIWLNKYDAPQNKPFVITDDDRKEYPDLTCFEKGAMFLTRVYEFSLRDVERFIRYLRILTTLCANEENRNFPYSAKQFTPGAKMLVIFAIVAVVKDAEWTRTNQNKDFDKYIDKLNQPFNDNLNSMEARWNTLIGTSLRWENDYSRIYTPTKSYLENMFDWELYEAQQRLDFMRTIINVLKLH